MDVGRRWLGRGGAARCERCGGQQGPPGRARARLLSAAQGAAWFARAAARLLRGLPEACGARRPAGRRRGCLLSGPGWLQPFGVGGGAPGARRGEGVGWGEVGVPPRAASGTTPPPARTRAHAQRTCISSVCSSCASASAGSATSAAWSAAMSGGTRAGSGSIVRVRTAGRAARARRGLSRARSSGPLPCRKTRDARPAGAWVPDYMALTL